MAKIKIGQKILAMISSMNKGILLHREKRRGRRKERGEERQKNYQLRY